LEEGGPSTILAKPAIFFWLPEPELSVPPPLGIGGNFFSWLPEPEFSIPRMGGWDWETDRPLRAGWLGRSGGNGGAPGAAATPSGVTCGGVPYCPTFHFQFATHPLLHKGVRGSFPRASMPPPPNVIGPPVCLNLPPPPAPCGPSACLTPHRPLCDAKTQWGSLLPPEAATSPYFEVTSGSLRADILWCGGGGW